MNCPICFKDIKKSSLTTVILECHHILCETCAKSWLLQKKMTCPLCRQETFYYDKNTRSKYISIQIKNELNQEWVSLLNTYEFKIPIKIFLQFIEKYFIQKDKKYIWYRQKNKYLQIHFQKICILKVLSKPHLKYKDRNMILSFIHQGASPPLNIR